MTYRINGFLSCQCVEIVWCSLKRLFRISVADVLQFLDLFWWISKLDCKFKVNIARKNRKIIFTAVIAVSNY